MERAAKKQNMNLMQLVYGKSTSTSNTSGNDLQDDSENEESDDEFFKPKGEGKKVCPGEHVACFFLLFFKFSVLQATDA